MNDKLSFSFSLTHRATIIGLAILFYVYDYLIQVMPSVMAHPLMSALHLNAQTFGYLSAGFFYTYILMQIPAGILIDRYPVRRILSMAILISGCGIALFSLSDYAWEALIGRALMGFGAAFAYLSALSLINQHTQHHHFACLAGVVQAGACVGALIGLTPVAALVATLGWRHTSFILALLTLIASACFYAIIRDQRMTHTDNQLPIAHTCVSLIQSKPVIALIICSSLCWIPVGTIGGLWGVPYLMAALHLSAIQASPIISILWITLAIGSIGIGYISRFIRYRYHLVTLCFLFNILGMLLLRQTTMLSISTAMLACALLGLSCSTQSFTFALLKDVVPPSQFATASSFNNMAAIAGAGIGQVAVGIIVHHAPTTLQGYHTAFLYLAISAIFALCIALFYLPRHLRTHS